MKLAELFGREPSDDELAAEMDLSIARIAELRNAAMRPVSLDAAMEPCLETPFLGWQDLVNTRLLKMLGLNSKTTL